MIALFSLLALSPFAHAEASALPPYLVWQEFRLARPEPCTELTKAMELVSVPANLAGSLYTWRTLSCGSVPDTDRISIAQYVEAESRDGDGALRAYLDLLAKLSFRGQKVQASPVRGVVAVRNLIVESKEGAAEPWKNETRRVALSPSHSAAVHEFSESARRFLGDDAGGFLSFAEEYLADANGWTFFQQDLTQAGLVRYQATFHVLTEDGRAYASPLEAYFDRDCTQQKCVR